MRVWKDNTAGVRAKPCYPEFHTTHRHNIDLGECGKVAGVGKRFGGSARDDEEEETLETSVLSFPPDSAAGRPHVRNGSRPPESGLLP